MRVAVFTDTYLPQVNGVSKTMGRMREYMKKKDIDSIFVTPTAPGKDPGLLPLPGLKFFIYPELSLAFPRYFYVKRIMDKFKPQVIHLATQFTVGLIGLKYACDRRIPIGASYTTNFPEYLSYYRIPGLKNAAWKYLRWFHSHAQVNFCPSQATAQLLQKQNIPNLHMMGRGIDEDGFSPLLRNNDLRKCWNIPDDHVVLLYVGRLAPEKELDILFQSISLLGDRPFRLLVVGDGPQRPELEKMAGDNVIFAGYRSGSDLRSLYASADIFVFPSSTETYGNVILEAMASGLPAVVPRAGGVQENLIDGFNGLYFKPHEPRAMAEAIVKLIDDCDLRQQMGQNALSHVKSKSWTAEFNKVFDIYRELIDRSSMKRFSFSKVSRAAKSLP